MESKTKYEEYYKLSTFFHKEYVKCNEMNHEMNHEMKIADISKECNELYENHKKFQEKYVKEIERRS